VDGTAGKDKLVGKVKGGIKDLLGMKLTLYLYAFGRCLLTPILTVLKSTGSNFENFYKDEHTTLLPVDDRIFSTSVDCTYTFADIPLPVPSVSCRSLVVCFSR
jgi:urate oxidase